MTHPNRPAAEPDDGDDSERARPRRRGRRLALRTLRLLAALVIVLLLGAWWALESDAVAERIRTLIESRGSAALGAPIRIGRLDLDVLPFHLELHEVRVGGAPDAVVALPGAEAETSNVSIARIDRLSLDLSPWGLIDNRIVVLNLELDRPEIRLDLPFERATGGGAASALQLEVRRLRVNDGRLVFAHDEMRVAGELEGIRVRLAPEAEGLFAGPFAAGVGELRVNDGRLDLTERYGEGAVLEPVEVRAVFGLRRDGLHVDDAVVVAGSSRIEARGRVEGLDTAELELDADLLIDDVETVWRPPFDGENEGRLVFDGNLLLRAGDPVVSGHVTTEEARIAGLPIESLSADVQLHTERASVRNVRAELLGGTVEGEVLADLTVRPSRVSVAYQLSGIDAAALTRWEMLDGWRVAGRIDATGDLSWSRPFGDTATGSGTLRVDLPGAETVELARRLAGAYRAETAHTDAAPDRLVHDVPVLPIPLTAGVDYRFSGGTLVLRDTRVELPQTTITIDGRVDLDGELLAAVRVESRDLRMLDHLAVQIRAATGGEQVRRLGLRGTATADLDLRGSVADPVVTGTLDSSAVALGDVTLGAVATTFRPEPGALVLDPLRITRRGGTAAGSARVGLGAGGDYRLDLGLDGYDLAAEPDLLGRPIDVEVVVSGSVTAAGRPGATPAVEFDLVSPGLEVGGVGMEGARARGRIDGEVWRIDELSATGLGGRLAATGSWNPTTGSLDGVVGVDDLDLSAVGRAAGLPTALAGRLSADATLAGPPGSLDGDAEVRWSDAAYGSLPLGDGVATARADAGAVTVAAIGDTTGGALPGAPDVVAGGAVTAPPPTLPEPPGDGWAASAVISTTAPYPASVRLRSRAGLAASLMARTGQAMPSGTAWDGRIDVIAEGPLGAPREWNGSATIEGFEVTQAPGFRVASDRVLVQVADGRLEATASFESAAGPFRLDATADLDDGSLSGTVSGDVDAAAVRLWRPELVVTGTADVAIDLGGTLSDPRVTGRVLVVDVAVDEGWKYPISDLDAELRLQGDTVTLVELTALADGNPVRGSGVLPIAALTADETRPDARVRLDLEVDDLPIGPVLSESEALSALVSSGALTADVHIEGRGVDWRGYDGRVAIEGLRIRMRDYEWALQGRVEAPLRVGRVEFPDGTRVAGTRTDFGLIGHVELAPLRLDLGLDGRIGLEPLNVLSDLWGTGGSAVADLRVFGPVGDLHFSGTAALENVVLSPPPLRQPIEDIDANLQFDDRRIRISDVTGELGGGPVTGSGELFLRDNAPQSFRFVVQVDNALVRLEREVRVRSSADLVFDGTPDRSLLTGSVRLIEGRYQRELEADDAILEILEAPETEPDPLLASVNLDLQVDGDRGLLIDNNLAQVEVTADYRVGGTLAEPVLLGRSVILGGELYWNDNIFEVLQGSVEFNNPFRTEAFFDVRARTDIRRYTVDLNFSGSFERGIAFDYSSTPSLSDLDLFNLLAFGEEPDSAVFQDPYAYQQALGLQATRYLTGAYLEEVERGAARLFGVDRFRIAPTLTGSETDATARLTIGKRISSDLYVTYSRLLSNSEEQLLTVEYELSQTMRLKGTRDEDGSFGIDFLVQKRIR